MKESLHNLGLLLLRVMMGSGMAYHGYGKIFGGHMDKFIAGVAHMGFQHPEIFAWAAALSEFVGGILIVLGLLTRLAALFIFVTMSVAAFITLASSPLDAKELALAYWAMAGCLLLTGPGAIAADATLSGKKSKG